MGSFFGIFRSFFVLMLAHFFLDFFVGIWPIYKTLAGIDIFQAGIILGIGGFAGELSQLFFGYFSDRGYRKAILLLGVLMSSAVLLVTAVHSFGYWLVLILMLMLGSGAFHPAANGMASVLAPRHPGKAILVFASGGALGLGFSQLLFTRVLELFQGHAYILYLPLLVVLAFLVRHRFPDLRSAQKSTSVKEFFKPILKNKRSLFLLYFAQVANQAVFVSFLFLLPDVLFARGCQSWLCMGGGHMCVIVGGAVSMILAGYLCDKYGHRIVLLTVLSGAFLSLYLFLGQRTLALSTNIFTLGLLGAFLGVGNPVIISWGNRLVPESPSTVSALLMGLAWCLGNLGPVLAGYLVKQFVFSPYVFAMGCMGLFLVASISLVFFVSRSRESEEGEVQQVPQSTMEEID